VAVWKVTDKKVEPFTGLQQRPTATHRTVSVYRVLQMRGGGYADVLPVLQVPDNKADVVPCERLQEKRLVEVYYVGTHEKADYGRIC